MNLEDIRTRAFQFSADVLGRGAIEDVTVTEVPPDDTAVVALILEQQKQKPASTQAATARTSCTNGKGGNERFSTCNGIAHFSLSSSLKTQKRPP